MAPPNIAGRCEEGGGGVMAGLLICGSYMIQPVEQGYRSTVTWRHNTALEYSKTLSNTIREWNMLYSEMIQSQIGLYIIV